MKHLDFLVLDTLCLHLAFVLAYWIRHEVGMSPYAQEVYGSLAVVMTVAEWAIAVLFDFMHNVRSRGWYIEMACTVKHAMLLFGVLVVYMFSLKASANYSRIVIYLTLGLHILLGYIGRMLWKAALSRFGGQDHARSMLLVADAALAETAISQLKAGEDGTMRLVGVVLTDAESESVDGVPCVTGIQDAAQYICREWVDEVVFCTEQPLEQTQKLLSQCLEMGVVVHEVLDVQNSVGHKQFVEKIGNFQVLTNSVNYATPLQATLKRLIDIVGALAGLVATFFVVLFVGPKIYHESPGPIFFRQERVGKNGKRFRMIKLRSMYLDAEERKQALMDQNRVADGMMFKLDFDPRIIGNRILPDGSHQTGVGDFIRRTSLDEFPQFWNVLKGDMSLVGTRPPTVDEWEKYDLHHRARLAMKPGITGLWQVSGRSEITNFEDVVKLDTEYIYNWSMGLDFRIMVRTVQAILKKDGAM